MSSDVGYEDRLLLLEDLRIPDAYTFTVVIPQGTIGTYTEIGNRFQEMYPSRRLLETIKVFNITNGNIYTFSIGQHAVHLNRALAMEAGPLAQKSDFAVLMLCKLPLEILAQYVDHPFAKGEYGFIVKMRMAGEF